MDWKLVCEIGIKVLTATVAGAAVFVGISKAMTESGAKKKQVNQGGSQQQQTQKPQNNPFASAQQPPMQGQVTQQDVEEEHVVLKSMRATQDTCSKLLAFIQSLTMVTENLTRIFGGNVGGAPQGGYYIPGSQPYYNDPWSYRQPVNAGNGQTWTRVSPFIIEAGPVNPNSRCFY